MSSIVGFKCHAILFTAAIPSPASRTPPTPTSVVQPPVKEEPKPVEIIEPVVEFQTDDGQWGKEEPEEVEASEEETQEVKCSFCCSFKFCLAFKSCSGRLCQVQSCKS